MILRELAKVFLMSLLTITAILLLAGIVAEASQQGLAPGQILAAIPLLIPSTLPYTIPATTLFATCVVYGRMAADNEILAIKSAGINLIKVVGPGVAVGVVMSGVTMGLYYHLIPYSHHLLRAMVFNDAEELLYSIIQKNKCLRHNQMPYEMYVKDVQGRKLVSPVFKRRAQGGQSNQTDVVAQAREAYMRVNMAKRQVLLHMRYGVATLEDGSPVYFEDREWEVPLPQNFGPESTKRPRDLTWQELRAKREQLQQQVDAKATEIALTASQQLMEGAPSSLPEHLKNLRFELAHLQSQIRYIDVEMQMRPALSFGCLCFILVGCPFGIWLGKSDYLSAFITCFLPICILYYPLMLCGTGMAKEGRINMYPLVWGANAVVGVIGLGLFWKLLKN
jgi:lipopolysaccharide export system permease protein